jgi:hypothetical protein
VPEVRGSLLRRHGSTAACYCCGLAYSLADRWSELVIIRNIYPLIDAWPAKEMPKE